MAGRHWLILAASMWGACTAAARAQDALGALPPDTPADVPLTAEPLGPGDHYTAADSALTIRVYPVADLVAEPEPVETGAVTTRAENSPGAGTSHAAHGSFLQRSLENLAELSMIVQSVVHPDSWEMAGGPGRISVHGQTCSFVIRQTQAAHDEVAQLLSDLREQANVEVELSWTIVGPPTGDDDAAATAARRALTDLGHQVNKPLTADQLRKVLGDLKMTCDVQAPMRLQLRNGRPAKVGVVAVTGVVAADRRSVQLELAVPGVGPEEPPVRFSCRIPDQRALLLPSNVEGGGPARSFLSVSIVVPEEEEELLDAPVEQITEGVPALAPAATN